MYRQLHLATKHPAPTHTTSGAQCSSSASARYLPGSMAGLSFLLLRWFCCCCWFIHENLQADNLTVPCSNTGLSHSFLSLIPTLTFCVRLQCLLSFSLEWWLLKYCLFFIPTVKKSPTFPPFLYISSSSLPFLETWLKISCRVLDSAAFMPAVY